MTDAAASTRVPELMSQLTLDEKASLTAGVDMWHGHGVERLGIPGLKVSDGPAGVRGDRWVGTTSACAPCGTALGATWNPGLLRAVGVVLGEEAGSKSVDLVLGPTVNLHRNPLAGRNFECFSEDPHLTATSAVAIIDGIQSTGVGACVKHLVANDSEFERHTISSEVGERVLRELYLRPFEAAVRDAGVIAVMSAYNRLNGTYCAQHQWLLRRVLKDEWGFDGIVVSDWWGTRGDEAAEAGLDLEMPGPAVHLGPRVAERVRAGELDETVLDDAVRRLLGVAERLGVLDSGARPPEHSEDRAEHREVLRRAARESVVLLRNDAVGGVPVLPLDPDGLRRVAVIGPNADVPAALGGGSAALTPHHVVTVLDGLRDALGEQVEVVHEIGVDSWRTAPPLDVRRTRTPDGTARGLTVEYFANLELSGDPVATERIDSPRMSWIGEGPDPGIDLTDFSLRLRGTFVADVGGTHTFTLVTAGRGGRVLLDGQVVLDDVANRRPGTAFFGLGSAEQRCTVELGAGQQVELVAEFVSFDSLAVAALLVGHLPPIPDDGIERAAAAAGDSDVAVVVVGLDQDTETEGEDRRTLELPGRQSELVRAVTAANPRTVVVVNAGSVVDLDAADGAPALLQSWYLGQETGHAVADLLLGTHSPSGRLPTTYGRRVEDWPSWLNYPGEGGRVLYGEELFVGHRGFEERGVEPRFCFGHGLTYSRFDWVDARVDHDELQIAGDVPGGDGPGSGGPAVRVSVHVTNVGERNAAEVVQCYVHDGTGSLRQPDQQLRGFAKVALAAAESTTVVIDLDARAFAAWDPDTAHWRVPAGDFEVRLGASSQDIRAVLPVEVVDREPGPTTSAER